MVFGSSTPLLSSWSTSRTPTGHSGSGPHRYSTFIGSRSTVSTPTREIFVLQVLRSAEADISRQARTWCLNR